MVTIDGERLLDDLRTLRTFGGQGTGVVRPTFSPQDMEARAWLRDRMSDAGLDATIDGIGNVFGRSPNPGPALVIGSHSDTQSEGGWLDGAMGVIDALEVARALLADPSTAHLAVDVAAWADEEGTYASCLGARSFVGDLDEATLSSTNVDGESVAEALQRVGLSDVERVRFDPDRHVGYLEAHIEQGPHLEESGRRIGIVTSIVGIRGCHVTILGEQNHAGTTPMHRRKDAAVALFEFGSRLQRAMAGAAGPVSVWTTGRVTVEPGAESIVPDRAEVVVQFRDPDDSTLDRMAAAVDTTAAEVRGELPAGIEVEHHRAIRPCVMDPDLRRHLAAAADRQAPGAWVEMPSAAGHDPMVLWRHLPCAMVFIPSIGGVSHDFAEDSHDDDIVLGCQVLADAAASILRR
ncbi:MAG: hydantoinase/carbamoylase family amidase [Ilumatobacter sp.]|nr:hydantoinase/carbamoylase family amidase [Ilumatobacter sp.]